MSNSTVETPVAPGGHAHEAELDRWAKATPMSLSSVTSRIRSLNDDISRIQGKIADIAREEARVSDRISSATSSMSRASSLSQAERYSRDIERYQRDLARLQKKRADESRNLARRQQDLARCQKDLTREQEREAKRTQDALSRLEAQSRQEQMSALRSVAPQESDLPPPEAQYAAFISHASEDKEDLVRPLAEALTALGHKVWYDEFALKVGDSLRRSIDRGLASSRFGIVVLSPDFFAKNWPQYELDGLVTREQSGRKKVLLPLWHSVLKNDVLKYSPPLADRVALNTAMFTVEELAQQLHEVLEEE